MGLLADYNALSADQAQLAVLNGNVVSAQAGLDAANAAVAAQNIQIGNDTVAVVNDLQADPYNGFAAIVTMTPPTTITLLSVVPPVPPSTQAGLAAQTINVAT